MPAKDAPIAAMVTAPITPGSLVLIAGKLFEEDEMAYVMNELRRTAGHEQFMVIQAPPGVGINVAGPDDLVDALRRLAKESADAAT